MKMRRGLQNSRGLLAVAVVAIAAGLSVGATSGGAWESRASMPQPRSEVAGTLWKGGIVVVGGYREDRRSSRRVDVYDPRRNRWRRLPSLPIAVNHAMAASDADDLYVVGGYGADGGARREAFRLHGRRWLRLPLMPGPRAAGGAAVVRNKLYVVGGVGHNGLADTMLVFDKGKGRWRERPGPTPREHLGVAALGGRIFVVGGRTAGFDTNLTIAEVFRPRVGTWKRLPPVPEARGGTGLAAAGGLLVSVGGEETAGSIESVYAYDRSKRRWIPLPDLPTPRHGLAVVGRGNVVFAIGGGPEPGLSVSPANERLRVR